MSAILRRGLVCTLLAVALGTACGPGDDSTPTPAPTTPTSPAPGSPGAGGATLNLSDGVPLSLIHGADGGDYANDLPALAAGDVNGDTFEDLLIGARFGDGAQNGRQDSGEAYLIYGRADLPATIDLALGEADVTIYGAQGVGAASPQGDQVGFSGALGDVDGDGVDDIILGAPMATRQDTHAIAGAAYVIRGRSDLPSVIDLASGAEMTMLGAYSSSLFGDAVIAGDMDGDGKAEVVVGSPFEPRPRDMDRGGQQAGAVFIFRGGDLTRETRDTGAGDFDMVIYGKEEFEGGDETGDNLASGDLNDDGYADVVITGEAADGPDNERSVAAEAYAVYGSEDLGGVVDIGADEQDVIVYGADANDTSGFNVGAADVTGDGVDDMLVSMRGGDGEGNNSPEAGELHIFPGPSLPRVIDLADYADDRYLYGASPADFLGNGLAVLDWNGDGAPDLAVGSPMGDGPADDQATFGDAGEAHVVDARQLTGGVPIDRASVLLTVYGARASDGLGQSLASGDFNGDGKADLVMLAMRADRTDGSQVDSGAIYIVSR